MTTRMRDETSNAAKYRPGAADRSTPIQSKMDQLYSLTTGKPSIEPATSDRFKTSREPAASEFGRMIW